MIGIVCAIYVHTILLSIFHLNSYKAPMRLMKKCWSCRKVIRLFNGIQHEHSTLYSVSAFNVWKIFSVLYVFVLHLLSFIETHVSILRMYLKSKYCIYHAAGISFFSILSEYHENYINSKLQWISQN